MRIRFKIWILLLLASSGCSSLFAQQRIYNFLQFTTRDGLPSNNIYGLVKDLNGLIWVSTSKGLSYFDGQGFHTIDFFDEEVPYSNDLGSMAMDKKGRFWITTHNQGLLCYDHSKPPKSAISTYEAMIEGKGLIKSELYAVMVAQSGQIYFGGQETDLQILDPETQKVRHIDLSSRLGKKNLTIFDLAEDADGSIWISTRYDGVIQYIPASGRIKVHNLANEGENGGGPFVFTPSTVYVPYYDHDIIALDRKTGHVHTSLLDLAKNTQFYDNAIVSLTYLPLENKLLAGHRSDGLYTFDITTGHQEQINWNKILPGTQKAGRIRNFLVTDDGYWMGTEEGLFFYSYNLNRFHDFFPINGQEPIHRLFDVGAETWYLTAHTFGQFDPTRNKMLSSYPLHGLNVSEISVFGGSLYFSTYDRGVFTFSLSERMLKPLSIIGETHGFEVADCNTVLIDTVADRPMLWIGSWNSGLYRYDLSSKKIRLYDERHGLPDHKIIRLGRDHAGRVWIGTDGHGLLLLKNKTSPVFEEFAHRNTLSSIPSNQVFAFLKSRDGHFWYSNAAPGIGQMSVRGGGFYFSQHKDNNALPWLYTSRMEEDAKGRIWMATRDGVMVFDPIKKLFYQLQKGNGICPPADWETYGFYMKGNSLFWCTDKGLVEGNLSLLQLEPRITQAPIVSIFQVLNRDESFRLSEKEILLNPSDNNFALSFSSIEQFVRKDIRFAYMLEGLDKEWIISDKNQKAVYTNIEGGSYRFKVKIGDIYGNWSPLIKEVLLYVRTPWYKTWAFRTGVVFSFLAIVFLFTRYRINQQKKINRLQAGFNTQLQKELQLKVEELQQQSFFIEQEKEEKLQSEFRRKLYESELRAIRSQMNPHFIFNILNSIEAYIVENDGEKASRLIHRFAMLTRIVLENSQLSFVTVESEKQLISLYLELEQERFSGKFDFDIQVDEEVRRLKVPSMLIQPLVENAVHHGIRHLMGKRGHITVSICKQGKQISIEVKDNGVGFSSNRAEHAHVFKTTSFGMKGVSERITMINLHQSEVKASLHYQSLPENDFFTTKVTIVLPGQGPYM